jgi:PPOX class probable F420-dependent enzyme
MSQQLSGDARALVDGKNFAVVSTIEPDGAPQTSLVWISREGDDLLFSTLRGRRKEQNLARDPRIAVLLFSVDDPYVYLEVRGRAEVTEQGGRELIDALANKYTGAAEFKEQRPDAVRVVVRVKADKVVWRSS